jgi:hypothetical protein
MGIAAYNRGSKVIRERIDREAAERRVVTRVLRGESKMVDAEFRRFHNGLRVLLNIDQSEFPGPAEDWPSFRDGPHRYFITCPDEVALALWRIIERRNQ